MLLPDIQFNTDTTVCCGLSVRTDFIRISGRYNRITIFFGRQEQLVKKVVSSIPGATDESVKHYIQVKLPAVRSTQPINIDPYFSRKLMSIVT